MQFCVLHLMPCQKKIFNLYKSVCIQAVKKKTGNKGGMVQYGRLNEFDADSKPITVYLESELYFKQCREWKACVDST